MPTVNINLDEELFLPCYRHLLNSDNNIEFLWGSRDSGKSRHIAQQLIVECLTARYFFCPLIRKVSNTIKDSQWQLIKSIVEEWELDQFFTFVVSPLEIRCKNGNKFIARGLDEPKNIKSLANPSHAWLEESSDYDEQDWILILTSLRSNYGKTHVWASFNPDMKLPYEETYLYKMFFKQFYEKNIVNFTSQLEIEVDGKKAVITYRSTHTIYKQNPYCPPDRAFYYENLKNTDPYAYMVYAKGMFGLKITGGAFYNAFSLKDHVKGLHYNSDFPVHISIDYNYLPYIAITAWQIIKTDNKTIIRQIHELPAGEPDNTASKAGEKVGKWLTSIGNNETVYLYGDWSTKNANGIDDNKKSFFRKLKDAIENEGFKCEDKLQPHGSVSLMRDFINSIFRNEVEGFEIQINETCKTSISDYLETKSDENGCIQKKRVTDAKTGVSYEPHGHICDNLKDFVCQAFRNEFKRNSSRTKTTTYKSSNSLSKSNKNFY